MSQNYDLTSGLDESFTFKATLKGKIHEYEVFYPSQKDLMPIQRGYSRIQEIEKEYAKLNDKDTKKKSLLEEEVKNIGLEMNNAFNSFFKPLNDSMQVSDLVDQLPLPAKKKFDEMVKKEFSVE